MTARPRRTPWSSPDEFHHVYASLFSQESNLSTQRFAIDRIKVWMSKGNCPYAVESTICLLEVILRDTAPSTSKPSHQELRLAYSMSLIRFVNSQIDPLQTTYFAKSMASLANQLGLPIWFIELRHAATHEDLPALSVLRDAAKQALDWLYLNYWLPVVNPTSAQQQLPPLSLDSLPSLLSSYKTFTKTCLRDASKVSKTKTELLKVYRGIERWIIEAEGMGRGREMALSGVTEALLEVGGLVPTARKKRASTRSPTLSNELASIWTPLLSRLEDAHEGFIETLLFRMVDVLAIPDDPAPLSIHVPDRSQTLTIVAWIVHFLSCSDDATLTEQIVKACLLSSTSNTLILLDTLAKGNSSLASVVQPLLHVLRNADSGLDVTMSNDEAKTGLELMEARMLEMEARLQSKSKKEQLHSRVQPVLSNETKVGWQLISESEWRPCPIGVVLPLGSPGSIVLMSTLDLVRPV